MNFTAAQTTVATGLTSIFGVGADSAGNIYYPDRTNSEIWRVTPPAGTPSVVATGIYARNLTVDAGGDVFAVVASPSNTDTVVRIPSNGGAPSTVGAFDGVITLAVDPHDNNLYVVDFAGLWRLPTNGSGAPAQVSIPGIKSYSLICFDSAGNLYATGYNFAGYFGLTEILVNGSADILTGTPIVSDVSSSTYGGGYGGALAADALGNVYVAYYQISVTELPAVPGAPGTVGTPFDIGGTLPGANSLAFSSTGLYVSTAALGLVRLLPNTNGGVHFDSVNVCTVGQTQPAPCSETLTLYYSVGIGGTFGTPVVQGNDFTVVADGTTCTGSVSDFCTVVVTFAPRVAGARSGVLQIVDTSSNVLATTGLSGTALGNAPENAFIAQTPGPIRNNYSGFVGFAFTTANPIQISSLGRYVAPGNSGTHLLKLVQANGVDFPGGSTTISTAGVPAGQYAYATLATPIVLEPNTTAYLVSQETANGDQWYDYGPVSSTTDLIVLGPTYTDSGSHYILVNDPAASYVPVTFLYTQGGSVLPLSATVTSPLSGALLSGIASVVVSSTGSVTALQLQVDGKNYGSSVAASGSGPSYTLSLDTTAFLNGSHTLSVVVTSGQMNTAASSSVTVNFSNTQGGYSSFITGQTLGPLRNNYSGFVGFKMTVGNAPVSVQYLGRYVAAGDNGTHLLKLVNSNGVDVAGAAVSLSLTAVKAGSFSYAAPSSPVTLQANTTYYLVSQEFAGGDSWYDLAPVMTTSVATIGAAVYSDGRGVLQSASGTGDYSYVPLSFLYGGSALSLQITSPLAGALISGNNISVGVTSSGSAQTTFQLLVDGVSQGSPALSGHVVLNTTGLSNGSHTLTVTAQDGANTAVSAPVIVTVNNGGAIPKPLITGESPTTLRNNYSGFVGTAIQVGSTPLSVTGLGRFVVAGNSGMHTLKLVQASGIDLPGGSVTLNTGTATAGQFSYATLPSPVSLAANTTYYLVSQEAANGDQWYDFAPVTPTKAAQIAGPVYSDAHGDYVLAGGFPAYSYGPVSLLYQ